MTTQLCSLIPKIEKFGQTRCAASRQKKLRWLQTRQQMYMDALTDLVLPICRCSFHLWFKCTFFIQRPRIAFANLFLFLELNYIAERSFIFLPNQKIFVHQKVVTFQSSEISASASSYEFSFYRKSNTNRNRKKHFALGFLQKLDS